MKRPKELNRLMAKAKLSHLNLHEKRMIKLLHEQYLVDLAKERTHPKIFNLA